MEKWENPGTVSEHLLPPHAWFPEDRVSLDGKWRYLELSGGEALPEGWEMPEFSDKKWEKRAVPGCWENAAVQTGQRISLYRRSFIVSKDPGSRQTILELEYPPSCAQVWVNGTCIGMTSGWGVRGEFDITAAVRPKKNTVAVLVPHGSVVGIPGSISLYTRPTRCITDLQTEVRWHNDSNPLLLIRAKVQNAEGYTARIALMDGKTVAGYCESKVINGAANAVLECSKIQLWCAEQPKLYRVAVILWDGIAIHHTREITIGFRLPDLSNGRLTVNEQAEKLLGVAYRPFDPETGCVLSQMELERDLCEIRRHNFNTVFLREPAPEAFYAICDRIGLYVVNSMDRDTPDEVRSNRLAAAHGNHPCIVFWELAAKHPGILSLDQLILLDHPTEEVIRTHCAETASPAIVRFSGTGPSNTAVSLIRSEKCICGGIWPEYRVRFASPDGVPLPALREAKEILQPICCSYSDGSLTIRNFSAFRSTSELECRYILTRDGSVVVDNSLPTAVPPGGTASIPLEIRYDIYKPGRYHLTVRFQDQNTGEVLSGSQWAVAHLKHIYDENPGGTIREEAGIIYLRAQDACYAIGRSGGLMEQFLSGDRRLLAAALHPVYTLKVIAGFHFPDEWEKLTTRKKKLKPAVLEVDHMTRTVSASFHLGSGLIQNYRLFADGSLSVELRLRTGRTAPDCIGFQCALPSELDRCEWFGLGPDDCEGQPQPGRFFGIHTQSVVPQESGMKAAVYHLRITNAEGVGLGIRSEDGLRFSFVRSAKGENKLTVLLPTEEAPKPHTTYYFHFTLHTIQ